MRIQQLTPEHWQQYRNIRLEAVKVDPEAFGNAYEEELALHEDQWCAFIGNMYFAMIDDRVVGMIGLLTNSGIRNKHRAQMISFWVYPEYRSRGIGTALITHIQDAARQKGIFKIDLNVMVTQSNAIELYQKNGFVVVGITRAYSYVNNAFLDAIIMEWLDPALS